jgi:nicotinate-nucleotide adenylyltransferase
MRPTPNGGPRIALFGGSFDPPHLGHIAVARAAREALGLDCVLFAPVGAQPLKPAGPTAGFDDRVAMTRLAIEGEAGFVLSLVDAPRPDGIPNYTMDTLERLREELPAGSALYCLMGADSLAGLRKWHRGEEISFSAPLIVASRPGQVLDNLKAMLPDGLRLEAEDDGAGNAAGSGIAVRCYRIEGLAGRRAPFFLLPGLDVEISASEIREGIREGACEGESAGLRGLLSPAVEAYIRAHGLYCEGG